MIRRGIVLSYLPNLFVGIFFKGIEIAPHGAFKHGWILRDDTEFGPQIMKSNCCYVDVINHNMTFYRIDCPKKSLY